MHMHSVCILCQQLEVSSAEFLSVISVSYLCLYGSVIAGLLKGF